MGKGCGLSAGSRYAYSLADACTSDNPFLVWMKLKEGYDPNGSYIGVTAMQIACEIPNADIFLLLLKFGADPEKRTSSRARGVSYSSGETPRMICARRSKEARDPEKKANYERMLLWIDNLVDIMKEERNKAAEELMPRLAEMGERERAANLSFSGQLFTCVLLIFVTVMALHCLIIFLPDFANEYLPEVVTSYLCLFSPVFMGKSLLEPFPDPAPGIYGYCVVYEDGAIKPLIASAVEEFGKAAAAVAQAVGQAPKPEL